MTIHEEKRAGYITLKEASERFGYAPDYIGQLIRKGKIEGKQVYANVAWMTTEASMMDYVATLSSQAEEKHSEKTEVSPWSFFTPPSFERFMAVLFTEQMTRVYVWGMRAMLVVLLVALVFVFYFLSIVIDRKLTKVAELRVEGSSRMTQEQVFYEPSSRLTYEK